MLLRLRMMAWKEWIQIVRDPRLLAVVVALPMLMLLLYGYAINLDVRHVKLAVYDQDRSQASRALIGAFSRSQYFTIVEYPDSFRAVIDALDDGHVRLALIIPLTYSGDLAAGRTAPVQVLVDGADSTTASTAIGYVGAIMREQSRRIALRAIQRAGGGSAVAVQPVENRVRYWYNPELKSSYFLVPGLAAAILMMLAALLTSVSVVRERERGTLESLIVSPVQASDVLLGKLIPYVIIAFCDMLLVMLVSVFVFQVPLRGNPLLALLLSLVFVIAALSIGLLISTVAPSQQIAMTGAIMVSQLPTMLLSGFIFPISSMPYPIQLLTIIIPARHFITILRGIFLKGSGVALIWPSGLFLLGIGVLFFSVSMARFKKKLS